MTPTAVITCPKCRKPLEQNSKFCANCGNDVSGVWSTNPALGGTIAVEVDPNVDTLGQMLGEATLGDYDIYGELGRGGMAAVYLGLDIALNRKVAIKTMLPELLSREGMVQRFKREAQTSAALSHPHIIQIYTVKESNKLVYFVMKFIEGRSLESVITDKGKVPLGMAQTIMSQVGSALDYAHRKHVVHRDIKPANIMIDEDGWAIVTDFGIAKVQEAQNLTATGTAIGTPHYMSPEQFHNKAVTGLSDQYSLGVVLYEMLAGKKPFDGATYAEIITQHLFEQVPDLREVNPEVPEHVVEVVRKMLAKEPSERFPDLDAAVHALGAPADKKAGDVVRTQMISLAKSGPQKKVRMSVPMSPIPVQKKQTAAATAIEPKAKGKARPRPQAEAPKSGAGKWIGIAAVLLLLVGGGGGYYYMNFMRPKPDTTPAPGPVAQGTPAQTDSQAATAAAAGDSTSPAVTSPPAPNQDSVIAAAVAKQLAEARRKDSVNAAKAAARQRLAESTKRPATETKTDAPAVQQQQAPPPAPAAPLKGSIRIGTTTPGAILYINDAAHGALSGLQTIEVTAGAALKLTIRAENCQPWDTTFYMPPGQQVTVGRRFPKCQ